MRFLFFSSAHGLFSPLVLILPLVERFVRVDRVVLVDLGRVLSPGFVLAHQLHHLHSVIVFSVGAQILLSVCLLWLLVALQHVLLVLIFKVSLVVAGKGRGVRVADHLAIQLGLHPRRFLTLPVLLVSSLKRASQCLSLQTIDGFFGEIVRALEGRLGVLRLLHDTGTMPSFVLVPLAFALVVRLFVVKLLAAAVDHLMMAVLLVLVALQEGLLLGCQRGKLLPGDLLECPLVDYATHLVARIAIRRLARVLLAACRVAGHARIEQPVSPVSAI